MRLFVGVGLSGPAAEAVREVRDKLVMSLSRQGVRFVRPEKLHLTLSFLGNVSESAVPELSRALDELASTGSFALTLDGLGAFPNERRPKVIWIGLGGQVEDLEKLAARVVALTGRFSEHKEDRPYSPHLTLARINPGSQQIGRELQSMRIQVPGARWPVEEVTLFHSHPDGSYVPLHQVKLHGS